MTLFPSKSRSEVLEIRFTTYLFLRNKTQSRTLIYRILNLSSFIFYIYNLLVYIFLKFFYYPQTPNSTCQSLLTENINFGIIKELDVIYYKSPKLPYTLNLIFFIFNPSLYFLCSEEENHSSFPGIIPLPAH